ncbi:hypothetical protein BDV96DRAFT_496095 [Lophiotrema nucula]|uniref:P-loop containing nucleoside triphosphate hydrolase protein n=1 Tax=Lophiotrema nucula TaxID=690887 RepID=A0A6A5Z303_9PLEO|nr:hypothetical protein BDV96DRAFT_496095 [Lophiotrema nucula]
MPRDRTQETRESEDEFDVRHAPLVSGDIVDQSSNDLLPQSGFLGTQGSGEMEVSRSKIFVNSNAPFSTFICGVQGSGKSHTTACFLENAILSSPVLGRAGKPLSALVFSYGEYSSVGSGFSVSEVAFLGSPNSAFPKLTPVRKINVLVSATNPGIRRLYERLPNVTVTAFKLKPWLLDIGTILTFMNVHTDKEGPLYMAQFNNVLREIATECDGRFDYRMLKPKLKACRFDFRQMKFLQMRLNLLESFLDLNNAYPDPQYRPGEITIIDMSCPFVDASTACTLFKLGLQRYLQSQAPGKMVVLDEAHKYMLNVPGAKALNESLLTTIRLQRHYGTRVIVSTQEPTLLTSLIALCSVVIVHRFTSPEWFAALKKHIIIPQEDEKDVIRAIEQLRTGTALVYSSNAVLGRNGDGTLDKGAGRLVVMKMRKRITFDGGQSILCE